MGLFDSETENKLKKIFGLNNKRFITNGKKQVVVEERKITAPKVKKTVAIKNIKKNEKIEDIFIPKQPKEDTININENLPPVDLCIGLDIGTSTTKVVIKQLYAPENDSFYLVDFDEYGIKEQEYLLPTYLYKLEDKFFIPKFGKKYNITNLKLNFIKDKENASLYMRAYIALVIQYAKNWFVKKHGKDDIIKNRKIYWQINLGIPSAQFNNNGENAKFLKILKEASSLSKNSYITENSLIEEDKETELNIVPEIIASIQSYIRRKDIANNGLYCVADIGAGTLDVCTFRIAENTDGNIIYSFFKSKVEPLGTKEYQSSLIKYKNSLSDIIQKKEKELQAKSIENIVTDNNEYLITNEIQQRQKQDIENYKNTVMTSLRTVLHKTYKHRDPFAREWTSYLPFAIAGGGIAISFYQDIILKDLNDWIIKNCGDHQALKRCKGFKYIDIKERQGYFISNFKNIDYSRLAVATGLSYQISDFEEIKKYYKECEIEDIEISGKYNIEDNYIDKSQM